MMILIYRIVLFGNILLTWATLQQPYMSKTLLAPLPQNKNDWVHSAIFEPLPKMLLTCSTYKITSFLEFHPFLQSFQTVNTYLHDLLLDIVDLTYYKKLIAHYHNIPPIITSNWSVVGFLKSSGCTEHPYACRAKLKCDHFKLEIQCMYNMK